MAFLVIQLKDGRRAWYRRTDVRFRYGVVQHIPLFDDEKGKEVSLDFAIDAARTWQDYCRVNFSSNVFVVIEKYGEPLDVGQSPSGTRPPDVRQKRFVKFTNGLGLYVTPGRNAEGEAWFVRAVDVPAFAEDNQHTAIESVSGKTPEDAASRAVDSWGQQILFRDPEEIAREIQERNRAAEQRNYIPGLRPGDRR